MKLTAADGERLAEAVGALRRGEVIGLPTETVYGLAADARNTDAVRKIFSLKGRPAEHPLIVHIAAAEQLSQWASHVPETAAKLAQAFWPGPLTLILKKRADVPDIVTGGQDTVGLRCPAHPLALAVLRQFAGGLAAPSANRFGRISPTTAQHVRDEFADGVPIVLDGGDCEVGIESTIVDVSGAVPRILRPGHISKLQLEAVIGPVSEGAHDQSPRVSGSLLSHYAPHTRTELLARPRLIERAQACLHNGERVLVLSIAHAVGNIPGLVLPDTPEAYGHDLYAALRELDAHGADRLLVESPPLRTEWIAVLDRLSRAAADLPEEEP
jgi:L-threonylcarbamoyladenylate synthase